MSNRIYRSAQGKSVDLGSLMLQNESVRAVGNMGVNARGDTVNPQNNTVKSRTQNVNKHYKKQVSRNNVSDKEVLPSKQAKSKIESFTPKPAPQAPAPEAVLDEALVAPVKQDVVAPVKQAEPAPIAKKPAPKRVAKKEPVVAEDILDSYNDDRLASAQDMAVKEVIAEPAPVAPPPVAKPLGGLADAIAKAKQITQEPLKTPRQISQETSGVRKI